MGRDTENGMRQARVDGLLQAAGIPADDLTAPALEALGLLAEQTGRVYDGLVELLWITRGRRDDLAPIVPAVGSTRLDYPNPREKPRRLPHETMP